MSTKEHWEVIQHSWREIEIYSSTRQIAMIDVENAFDVNEDNQDECEQIALMNANLIAAAPELLEFAEEVHRTGDTRLASMAIAVIAKAKGE